MIGSDEDDVDDMGKKVETLKSSRPRIGSEVDQQPKYSFRSDGPCAYKRYVEFWATHQLK